jgi:hypothetical protein
MECKKLLLQISDYIDGSLHPDEQAAVEEHLSQCLQCRTFVNTLKTTISLCQSLYEVPAPVHRSLHSVLRHEWEIHKVQVSVGVPRFPFVELAELKEQISISIELPGIKREDITLKVAPDHIEISGFHKKSEGVYYLNEINYGPFSRKIKLPAPVNSSRAH